MIYPHTSLKNESPASVSFHPFDISSPICSVSSIASSDELLQSFSCQLFYRPTFQLRHCKEYVPIAVRKRNAEGVVCPVPNSLGSHYATHRLDLPPSQAVVLMLFHQIVGILHPQCLMILDVTVQSCKNIVLYQFLYRPVLYDCELFYQAVCSCRDG